MRGGTKDTRGLETTLPLDEAKSSTFRENEYTGCFTFTPRIAARAKKMSTATDPKKKPRLFT